MSVFKSFSGLSISDALIFAAVSAFLLAPIPGISLNIKATVLVAGLFVVTLFLQRADARGSREIPAIPLAITAASSTEAFSSEPTETGATDLTVSTILALAVAIDARDNTAPGKLKRTQECTAAIARSLNLNSAECALASMAAVLHDVGKLGVPDYILLKRGPLSAEEQDKMRRHAVLGASILEPVAFPWPVADTVRHHHERWDGTGYPDHLSGDEIPLASRIVAVASNFVALTTDRPYRTAWSRQQAIQHLNRGAGTQFDPKVVAAFMTAIAAADAQWSYPESVREESQAGSRAAGHIRRTSSELWALREVSQALHATLDMQQKFELLADKITTILPGTACSFITFRPADSTPWSAPALGGVLPGESCAAERWLSQGRGTTLVHQQMHLDGDDIAVQAARARKSFRGANPTARVVSSDESGLESMRSALCVPMYHLGHALGTINLYHADPDKFNEDDELLLQVIAEQVQSAIYHDLLFDRTRSDSLTDSLTGLYNMRYLAQAIRPLLHRPPQSEPMIPFTLLYLDLDNFKPINDRLGHQQGNVVLQHVAELFQRELRPHDLVVRLGGDEFLVVLPQTTDDAANVVAERIREAIGEYRLDLLPEGEDEFRLGVSIGQASFPEDGVELDPLVAAADQRMYRDKFVRKQEAGGFPA